MKPLNEMTAEELSSALEVLGATRPEDFALRLALCLELDRADAGEDVRRGVPREVVRA
ncbi:mechanosensitive ion channel [Nocardiopsis sp. HUAS JQ3]|uniref:mechanosensitive ion channel n=1 Tax=Nocardiopsis sp. HUAS JQ3 TaxID=3061629 RepID=UPI0023A9DE58|nr:mechanosensitive ion channel [Nocardiopsis sp. HUAS JQ3]WDZ91079.1 mechanosensitive ion channel [Nocardiopsis sp. HUAS JQ3]